MKKPGITIVIAAGKGPNGPAAAEHKCPECGQAIPMEEDDEEDEDELDMLTKELASKKK